MNLDRLSIPSTARFFFLVVGQYRMNSGNSGRNLHLVSYLTLLISILHENIKIFVTQEKRKEPWLITHSKEMAGTLDMMKCAGVHTRTLLDHDPSTRPRRDKPLLRLMSMIPFLVWRDDAALIFHLFTLSKRFFCF